MSNELKIRIAVCDDSPEFINFTLTPYIKAALLQTQQAADIVYYDNGYELITKFKERDVFDIVFLDIDMPHIDGKNLAAELRKLDSLFFLVFVTDFEREVFNTLKYNINSFIPKNESCEKYIERLTDVFNEYKNYNPSYECFKVEGTQYPNDIVRVSISDVLYFSYYRKNIMIHTTKGEWYLKERVLSKVEEVYLKKGFFKISREVIVNLARISDIRDLYIKLDTGAKLEISRRNRKPVYDAFSDFITEQVK